MMRHTRRALTAVLLATMAAGCGVSTQQEIQLGNEYAAQIEAQLPIVGDPEINRYINVLGDSLAGVADDRGLDWSFRVVNAPEINAFAVIQIGGAAVFANFSRQDEAEADEVAVAYVTRAGIDPRGIPAMFRILLEERQRSPSGVDAWFSSHPLEEDRIAATEALIAQIDPAILATLTMDTRNFQLFKQRVASLPPPPPMQ